MKITKRQLKRIIKEEKQKILNETKIRKLVRRKLQEGLHNEDANWTLGTDNRWSMFVEILGSNEEDIEIYEIDGWSHHVDHESSPAEREKAWANVLTTANALIALGKKYGIANVGSVEPSDGRSDNAGGQTLNQLISTWMESLFDEPDSHDKALMDELPWPQLQS